VNNHVTECDADNSQVSVPGGVVVPITNGAPGPAVAVGVARRHNNQFRCGRWYVL